jgi:endo-1,3-1,4-beta-glycanase ExoK
MRLVQMAAAGLLVATAAPQLAHAVSSAELYTASSYSYGRVETRLRFAAGDGVVSSFFSWKDGSEQAGAFWNEVDFEKLGAECRLETNPIYGNPSANHSQRHALMLDLCGAFHVYAYEWTPDAMVWLVDGQEIRRETGATAQAFAEHASQAGMAVHFNVWPGDASFGGNFDPAILPVHEYIDWVQFSKFENGQFKVAWREDFNGKTLSGDWLTGSWESPKKKSTHTSQNVNLIDGYAVLSLTADNARGPAGAMPGATSSGGASSGGGGAMSGGAAGGGAAPTTAGAGSGGVAMSGGGTTSESSSGSGGTGPAPSTGGAGSVAATSGSGVGASAATTPVRSDGGCAMGRRPAHPAWFSGLALAALSYLLKRRSRA